MYDDILALQELFQQLKAMRFSDEQEFARQALMYRIAGSVFIDTFQSRGDPEPVAQARLEIQDFFLSYQGPRSPHDVDRTAWRNFNLPSTQQSTIGGNRPRLLPSDLVSPW